MGDESIMFAWVEMADELVVIVADLGALNRGVAVRNARKVHICV